MINIIAAVAKNGVIGKDGKLPWSLKKDMARFKRLTLSHTVVMGANTYREIGRPLPDRFNIIVSSTLNVNAENAVTLKSLSAAIEYSKRARGEKEIFILGGERLFAEALEIADKLYITHLDRDFDGDKYFPPIPDCFTLEKQTNISDGGIDTCFCEYARKRLPKARIRAII